MKKQLLIITSKSEQTVAWTEREKYVQEFSHALQALLDNYNVTFTTYQDLQIVVRKGKISIIDLRNDLDIEKVNFVHFKNWTFEYEDAATLAMILEKRGIPFYNSEVNNGMATGKIAQMVRLAEAGIRVPDTFYARQQNLAEIFKQNQLPEGFIFPIILKANDGSKGDDNFLINNAAEGVKVIEQQRERSKDYVIQNFIPNDGDLRLLYIGIDSPPLVFKRIAQSGSHLNNTSKGGSGEFIDHKTLAEDVLADARKAATILRREISGVDIIFNKHTGEHYVLEVNATPALATGYGQEEKLTKFAAFIESQQEIFEEE